MTENFVRKTNNINDIKKKETYTVHDLDLLQDKNGHAYIRIKNKNTEMNNTNDPYAYFYEITNTVRRVNNMQLTYQLENTGNLVMPLVMEVQHLDGEVQVTFAGNTVGVYKVNGVSGVYDKAHTTYTVPLTGDALPDIVVKTGNTIIDTYELHQPDVEQLDPLHPEFIKGWNKYKQMILRCDYMASMNRNRPYEISLSIDKTKVVLDFHKDTVMDEIRIQTVNQIGHKDQGTKLTYLCVPSSENCLYKRATFTPVFQTNVERFIVGYNGVNITFIHSLNAVYHDFKGSTPITPFYSPMLMLTGEDAILALRTNMPDDYEAFLQLSVTGELGVYGQGTKFTGGSQDEAFNQIAVSVPKAEKGMLPSKSICIFDAGHNLVNMIALDYTAYAISLGA